MPGIGMNTNPAIFQARASGACCLASCPPSLPSSPTSSSTSVDSARFIALTTAHRHPLAHRMELRHLADLHRRVHLRDHGRLGHLPCRELHAVVYAR